MLYPAHHVHALIMHSEQVSHIHIKLNCLMISNRPKGITKICKAKVKEGEIFSKVAMNRVHQTHSSPLLIELQEVMHDYKIFKQHCRITSRLVNQWNSLPQHVITSDSLNKFKNDIDQYWYETRYGQAKRPLTYILTFN